MVGMSDVLTVQFEHHKMAKDILDVVKAMFGRSPDLNKWMVFSGLLNTKMPTGRSVVDHILKLMEYIQEFKDKWWVDG